MILTLLMALAQAAFQPGAQDVVFVKSPPHSDADELKARFRSRENAGPYDVSKEKFRLLLPKSYAPGARWGLFIYLNADDSAGMPAGYAEVLEKQRLIALTPYRAGNSRNIFDRFRLAVDACFNGQRSFDIDPDRVIISGFSGGARVASMLGVAYADLFPGVLPLCGVNFYKDIPSEPGKSWPLGYIPVDEALKIAKATGRFALMTGEKDFNLKNTRAVFELGFKKEGFKQVRIFEVAGLGHSPPPAASLAQALTFLDRP